MFDCSTKAKWRILMDDDFLFGTKSREQCFSSTFVLSHVCLCALPAVIEN